MRPARRRLAWGAVGLLVALGALAAPFVAAFSGLEPVPAVTELPGGAFGVADGYVQAFVVPAGEGGALLVDCGEDPRASRLTAELARRQLQPRAIVLTHGHRDHVGGCEAFAGVPVYALEEERAVIEGRAASGGPVTRFSRLDPAHAPRLTRGLVDGEHLQVGELDVEVFAVPGHTAGSAAYLARGVLFLGDAATAQADGTIRNAPWVFSDDQAQAGRSLESLWRKLGRRVVEARAFSHSGTPSPAGEGGGEGKKDT